MTTKTNGFEGLADETTVTTGNSGGTSGAAFDQALNAVADTARAAHGTVSCRPTLSASGSGYVGWLASGSTWYARAYVYMTSAPPANLILLTPFSGTTIRVMVRILTGRQVQITDSGFVSRGQSTTVLALNAWYRIEAQFVVGTSAAGLCTVRIYSTPDGTTPTETITATAMTVAAWDRIRLGVDFSTAQTFSALWLDDVGISDTGWLGPAKQTVTGTAAASLGGATGTGQGRRIVRGTAAKAFTASATATGRRTVAGPAAASLGGLSATASGKRRVTATAAGHLAGLTGTATGTRTIRATATLTGSVTATAAGAVTAHGTASSSLTLSATASGTPTTIGTATATLGSLTAATTGTRTAHGTATAALEGTATVEGVREATGAAEALLNGVTATAVGSSTGEVLGTANGNLAALTATGTGRRTVHGSATVIAALTGTVEGRRRVNAEATAPSGLTATGEGSRTVRATLTATLAGLTATTTGARIVHAAATATLGGVTATGTVHRTVNGTAATVVAFTATATAPDDTTDVTVGAGPLARSWSAGQLTRTWRTGLAPRAWSAGQPTT